MFHISKDKRAYESATMILTGMDRLLLSRSFDEITVTDLCQESGVSRPTFYRLFDTPADVLRWHCDCAVAELVAALKASGMQPADWPFRFNLRYILEHPHPLEIVHRAGRVDIADAVFMQHMNEVLEPQRRYYNLSEEDMHFSATVVSSIITAAVCSWIDGGKRESVDRMFDKVLAVTHHLSLGGN